LATEGAFRKERALALCRGAGRDIAEAANAGLAFVSKSGSLRVELGQSGEGREDLMNNLPRTVLLALPPGDMPAVEAWWTSLDSPTQLELTHLWEKRSDSCSFARASDGDGAHHWMALPIRVGARLVDAEDGADRDDWNEDLYEYRVAHQADFPILRTFHICTAHAKARSVLAQGFIPADFVCPLANERCPMRKLLALKPGYSIKLCALTGSATE
jgi:hypothetical protein